MISYFAAVSPQVDINALVMDLSVKARGRMCYFCAMNIVRAACEHPQSNGRGVWNGEELKKNFQGENENGNRK